MMHMQTVAVDHGRLSVQTTNVRQKRSLPRGAFAQGEVAAEPIYAPIARECEEHGWMQNRADPYAGDRGLAAALQDPPQALLQTRPSPKSAMSSTRLATPAPDCPPNV